MGSADTVVAIGEIYSGNFSPARSHSCNSCKKTVSAKPYRMKEHHKECNGVTSNEHKQASAIQLMEESSYKERENSTPHPKKSKQENVSTDAGSLEFKSSMSNFTVILLNKLYFV